MKLMILKTLPGHEGKKINISSFSWHGWKKILFKQIDELEPAFESGDKKRIALGTLKVIQICIEIMAKLFKQGVSIEDAVHQHNKELCKEGCEACAITKINVNKRM